MDVPLLSIALNQSRYQQQSSILLLKEAMQVATADSDNLIKMISEKDVKSLQSAAQPHLGSTIDIKV